MKELMKLIQKSGLVSQGDDEKCPGWFDGESINEIEFCREFLESYPIRSYHDRFFDVDGQVDEEKLQAEILQIIEPYVRKGVARTVDRLTDALRIKSYTGEPEIQMDRIHVANGTLFLDGHFSSKKEFCINRLPVDYNPDAQPPENWIGFLNDLLYEEDRKAFQEFLGYVLLPTNKAQAMMLLIGSGGEGKSRVGVVLQSILGKNMNFGSIVKLASDRFYRADQEGILLLLDDDMKTSALSETGMLKAIITSETMFDLERKGKQSFQGRLNVRIIALSNGSLSALYDKSDAFYRRQLVIRVREKPKGRVDDRDLAEKMISEKEGIFLWCLDGLHRLIRQDYRFSVSDRMKANLEEVRKADDNIIDFYESSGYMRIEENTSATTRQMYGAYVKWCSDNLEKPMSERAFSQHLRRDQKKLGIQYIKNISIGANKRVRGYRGVYVDVNTDSF